MLAKSPERPSTPEAPRLRFLHRRSDCFRVERTQFPGRTFTRSRPAPFHGARDMGFTAYREPLGRRLRDLPGQWIDAAVASSQLKVGIAGPRGLQRFPFA